MKRVLLSLGILSIMGLAENIAIIKIDGMTCPLCTVAIKRSLKKTKGVIEAKVKLNTKKATVKFKEDINSTILLDAIKRAGYKGEILSITKVDKATHQPK